MDCGKHKRALEHETLYDKAMTEYATNLECGARKCPTVLGESRPSLPTLPITLPMAWALKSTQSRHTKFTDNQKQYLNAKFQVGERTGKKADPTEVSKAMRTAKDSNGERLISYEDFLTSQQINSYFSHLAAKRSIEVDQPDIEDETFRVYLVTRFCLKSAFSIHIQSHMTPTTSVSWC